MVRCQFYFNNTSQYDDYVNALSDIRNRGANASIFVVKSGCPAVLKFDVFSVYHMNDDGRYVCVELFDIYSEVTNVDTGNNISENILHGVTVGTACKYIMDLVMEVFG